MLYPLLLRRALWAAALMLFVPLAQRPQIRWGQVPAEHLAMTSYPADTNAAAVVLFEVAKVR